MTKEKILQDAIIKLLALADSVAHDIDPQTDAFEEYEGELNKIKSDLLNGLMGLGG